MGDPSNFVDDRPVADSNASFQMVSLLKLAKVTEEGVRFLSPHDGSPMFVHLVLEGFASLISYQAAYPRTLYIPPEFNRLRHNNAT